VPVGVLVVVPGVGPGTYIVEIGVVMTTTGGPDAVPVGVLVVVPGLGPGTNIVDIGVVI